MASEDSDNDNITEADSTNREKRLKLCKRSCATALKRLGSTLEPIQEKHPSIVGRVIRIQRMDNFQGI